MWRWGGAARAVSGGDDVLVLDHRERAVCAADDFEAVFVTEAGVEQRVPWWRLPDVVDELGRPVRSSPSFRGRRSFPGWYWASTSGGLVGFESWVQPLRRLVAVPMLEIAPCPRDQLELPTSLTFGSQSVECHEYCETCQL